MHVCQTLSLVNHQIGNILGEKPELQLEEKFSTRASVTDLTHIAFAQGLRNYSDKIETSNSSTSLSGLKKKQKKMKFQIAV